ncbi:ataxin-7-like protein 1 isoform X2 [Lycorma delicatula]|uniref:ataxin-7-like protein 1 isoform X2 n=1 Tax=Lycorma delicatula TaxID=130591 RepID=UPI003F5178D7
MMAMRSASPTRFQGQPWSNWTDFLGRISPKDMDLFGFCPERDQFSVVVCETCQAVVKPQSLKNHIEVRHSTEASNPPSSPVSKKAPLKSFKSVLKNGKSKVRLKTPSSVVIAKADSTTKPVVVNNNMVVASSSNVMDTTVDTGVVSSTTNPAKPVGSIMTNILANGIPNGTVTNGIVGINSSSLILTPPASDAMEDSESPVSSISLPVTNHMESDDKLSTDVLKNGELQPVVALSPLVNKPNSPAAPILSKPPPPPSVSLSVTSPLSNIPPVLSVAPTTVTSGLISNAKPRRIIRAERKSLSAKEKEYNADRHCGVVVGDAKPCTRSLTCRLHSMLMRRAVEGRSKTFDQLLADHRATKEAVIRQKKNNDSSHQNSSTVAVLNIQINEGIASTVGDGNSLARVNTTTVSGSGGSRTVNGGGGCGPPEMGIRLPVSLQSPSTVVSQATPTHGSFTSELLTATPLDTTTNTPLSSTVNLTVNGAPFLSPRSTHIKLSPYNKMIEPSEAATPNISTAVDITVTRAHPKPLALGLFNSHKIGGLIYNGRKFRMARHFVSDLEDLY